MIDPRTPILVGAGQITDTVGTPSSERSRVAFCAEAARRCRSGCAIFWNATPNSRVLRHD